MKEHNSQHRGFDVEMIDALDQVYNFEQDLTVYYVIDGTMDVQIDDTDYTLHKNDLIVVNIGVKEYKVRVENGVVCRMNYDYPVVTGILDKVSGAFICNSVKQPNHDYSELINHIRRLVYQHVGSTHKTQSYKVGLLYTILDVLIEGFYYERSDMNAAENTTDTKLQYIVRHIYDNYNAHISLSDVAKKLFVSTSTLSRLFKRESGVYFSDYVNYVRLKYTAARLSNSDQSITRIAMDCGFSNVSSFNRLFREFYDTSPKNYRLMIREAALEKKEQMDVLREKIQQEFIVDKEEHLEWVEEEAIVVDARNSIPLTSIWNKTINIGSLHRLSQVNIQFQALNIAKELGFSQVRLWNVFSKNLMISDGIHIGAFNYDKVDMIFDFLVTNKISAFLDFGRRPDMAIKSEGVTVFYEDECITFESRVVWEALVKDFIQHLVNRYGKNIIESWTFELTQSEEKHYSEVYQDDQYEYFEVFSYFYKTIKGVVPSAEVGGYSVFSGDKNDYFETFVKKCNEHGCIPDFISAMLFPYERIEKDIPGVYYRRNPEKDVDILWIEACKKILVENGLGSCKFYITEWNSSLSNRNYLNDSCFRSAYIVQKVSLLWDKVDMICLWFGSDWISSHFDSRYIVNGAGGIITKDNIKKPAWFALAFLNELGDQLLGVGKHHMIARCRDDSYVILCFNFKWLSLNYYLINEDEVPITRIQELFEDSDSLKLDIGIENMKEDGEYIVKKKVLDSEHGCVLTEWIRLGGDDQLERSEVIHIQNMSVPYMERSRITINNGKLHLPVQMRDQEVVLYHLYKPTK